MGLTFGAYLYYGVVIDDERWEGPEYWIQKPDSVLPEDWREDRMHTLEKCLRREGYDVSIESCGHGERSIYFLHTKEFQAYDGDSERIHSFEVEETYDAELRRALEFLKAPKKVYDQIGWWLAGYFCH